MRGAAWLAGWVAACAACAAQDGGVRATAKRGITGELEFRHEGAGLRARAQTDLSAPILLRLERDPRDGARYTARFIGAVEGEFDLRELIEREDGSPPRDLGPLMVRVVSTLPPGIGSDLFDAADLEVVVRGGYRTGLVAVAAVWAVVPIVVVAWRRARRRPVVEQVAEASAPTLADQLRPLVEAASRRTLSVAEQGRLELLLYHHWRERLSLGGVEVARAIARLKSHAEAGELLTAVEGWLHRREGAGVDEGRVVRLLEPYRSAPAAPESALRAGTA